jgi:molybdopterin-guanine dinucleotide biosynthesis protein A
MDAVSPSMIAGLILAGGRASRIGGGDKALIPLGGKTLLARAIDRLRPQVGRLLLSANGDPNRFAAYGLPVLADPVGGQWGPLAGILAGLEHLAVRWPDIRWLVSIPTDSPFLPDDLVVCLTLALQNGNAELAMASGGGRLQPVFALWPVSLADALRLALQQGLRKVDDFAQSRKLATATWSEDVFFNINSPDQLQEASRRL